MKNRLETEIAEEQHGFRAGEGTRDQILHLKMIIEKNREQTKMCICVSDYRKAFNTVVHGILWHERKKMGFQTHIIILIKNHYEQQQAAVRTAYGLSEWFSIG